MVTMPIETVPGEEFQFDWSDCNSFARRWGWGHESLLRVRAVLEPDQVLVLRPLHRPAPHPRGPGALLRVHRRRPRPRADRPHGPARQVQVQGLRLPSATLAFARHHDLALKACDAGDAKRKGKVISSGLIIGRLGMEHQVEDWVYEIRMGKPPAHLQTLTWMGRIDYGFHQVREIVGRVWPYIILGIGAGAAIHGYIPAGTMAKYMGKAWWSVPAMVLFGVPWYSNAAGVIPIVEALMEKGAALGTTLAFMMSVIAISFPEVVILRKVLKPKLIAVFIGVVAVGITIVGYIFNAIL